LLGFNDQSSWHVSAYIRMLDADAWCLIRILFRCYPKFSLGIMPPTLIQQIYHSPQKIPRMHWRIALQQGQTWVECFWVGAFNVQNEHHTKTYQAYILPVTGDSCHGLNPEHQGGGEVGEAQLSWLLTWHVGIRGCTVAVWSRPPTDSQSHRPLHKTLHIQLRGKLRRQRSTSSLSWRVADWDYV
jgi:hypothetical protein